MPFSRYMSKEAMSATATALDQALYRHDQWIKSLYSTLISRLPVDHRDVAEHPHRNCAFGQRYYSQEDKNLSDHPGFVAIAADHETMHTAAARMVEASASNEPISASL